jgi:hypothetical protein
VGVDALERFKRRLRLEIGCAPRLAARRKCRRKQQQFEHAGGTEARAM